MEERVFDYWVATLQDGYIGNIISIVNRAGGARSLLEMPDEQIKSGLGLSTGLAEHIIAGKRSIETLEEEYHQMGAAGISYVNHADKDFPEKLRNIASPPYGIFVKGCLPDPFKPSVAIIGARECSEYGRLMGEFFGDRLAKEGIQIISGMAWGIDGIAQTAALDAGGRSFGVLGCGVDIVYPSRNRVLYNRLCENGNGLISEYCPKTPAEARRFPPRNRIISALCDVLIVVEARAKSGTMITVDTASDQGKCVMIVPGRLTDNLSVGCLNLMYQGALPATSIESVLEQLDIKRQRKMKVSELSEGTVLLDNCCQKEPSPLTPVSLSQEQQKVASVLTLDPQTIEKIAGKAKMSENATMVALTELEIKELAKEVFHGYFVKRIRIS